MKVSECTAVVVTKGDRFITEVVRSLAAFGKFIVWDNSEREDCLVYGRYCGAAEAKHDWIYFIDDDTITDHQALCDLAQPDKVVCNMPQPWRPHYMGTRGISLVGFGCVFPRELLWEGFRAYDAAGLQHDEVFKRECDRVWTHGHRSRTIWADVAIRQMDYSRDADRMYRLPRVAADYAEIRRRIALIEQLGFAKVVAE